MGRPVRIVYSMGDTTPIATRKAELIALLRRNHSVEVSPDDIKEDAARNGVVWDG